MPRAPCPLRRCCLPLRWLFAGAAVLAAPALALDPSKSFHHYVRDGWSIEQGLPQISALSIAQDQQGYLWVGTQAGLARFDGHRFVTFAPPTVPELPGAYINDLLADAAGRLWVATYKGLAVRERGRFSTIAVPAAEDTALNIVALALDASGELLAAAGDTVYVVQAQQLLARHRLDGPARALLQRDDSLWIGSLGGVYRARIDSGLQFLPLPAESQRAMVTQLAWAAGRLWAGSSEGLFFFEQEHWQRYNESPSLANAPIEALREDRDGNLWVAEIAHVSRLRNGLPHERIVIDEAALSARRFFEDREGNLWLGSQWNGLTRLRNGWTRRFSVREGLHTPLLWSVAAGAEGELWVGSDEGVAVFRDGRFQQVVSGDALPHPNAYTLLVEGERVWIGTRRGLAVYQHGSLQRPPLFEPLRAAQINGLLRTRDGSLWLATTDGLYREAAGVLQRFGEAAGLADLRIRCLLETADGRLLVGSHAGLYQWTEGRLQALGLEQGLPAGLDVTALHELPNGQLALGSLNEELHYFDGRRWTLVSHRQGMPANAAFFFADDGEHLWMAGIRGVTRVGLDDLEGLAAGRQDRVAGQMLLNERGDRRGGQKGFCCNGAGLAKGLFRNGELWAPTRDGLVALRASDVALSGHTPNTLVERLRIGGQWQDFHPADDDEREIEASDRDLGFEFTAISFEDPRSVGFRYRLIGYHDDWREPDEIGQRVVSYTNLPPGGYRFEVQSSNASDAWSASAQVEFSIRPHFRETLSFYLLLALLTTLLGLFGYRLQRSRYARRAQQLEHLVQQRTEALAEANRRLEDASHTDPLTGLRNRRYLATQIPKDLAFYSRELRRVDSSSEVIVFAIVDIDHFKHINDDYGHAAGDRVLQQFAELLQHQVRGGDYVARWGGEEFILVFRPTPGEHVPMLGERVRAACADHLYEIGGSHPLRLTCSLGLVEFPLFAEGNERFGWEQLIELADRALYYVKRHGRNGWAAYRPSASMQPEYVLELLHLDENEFETQATLERVGHILGEAAARPD